MNHVWVVAGFASRPEQSAQDNLRKKLSAVLRQTFPQCAVEFEEGTGTWWQAAGTVLAGGGCWLAGVIAAWGIGRLLDSQANKLSGDLQEPSGGQVDSSTVPTSDAHRESGNSSADLEDEFEPFVALANELRESKPPALQFTIAEYDDERKEGIVVQLKYEYDAQAFSIIRCRNTDIDGIRKLTRP